MRRFPQRFYENESGGGGGQLPTPAPAPEPPAVPAAASDVAQHVDAAASSATQAAQQTGEGGWKELADELKGLRGDIKELSGKLPAPTPATPAAPAPEPTPAAPAPAAPAAPNVTPPKPPEMRTVRRNGRKVKRK